MRPVRLAPPLSAFRLAIARGVVGAAWVGASLVAGREALAAPGDKVAVLPFRASGGGGTTSAELDAARAATREAVTRMHDVLPSDAETVSADHAAKDGVADTSAEYRDAGRAAGAQWTVAGRVDAHGTGYRLEVEACEVATGRVESLAREIDLRQAAPQISEMLALLLRPQGMGDAMPPWDQPNPAPAAAPPPTPPAPLPPAPAAPVPPTPVDLGPPPAYAENHPFALGVGGLGLTAFARSPTARGSPAAALVTADVAYAFDGVRGLEAIANGAVSVAGPSSLWLDAGLRYEIPIVPRARIFLGPEVAIGTFIDLGGDKDARFLLRGALPIVIGLGERVQIEAYPAIAYAAGGTVGLAFVGGGLRGVVRF
jgi:hypothetical protein